MSSEKDIIGLNVAIGSISEELLAVQRALDEYRLKQERKEAPDEAAVEFVKKAELVIEKAEKGELELTPDQKRRIRNNLVTILKTLHGR